MGKIDTLYHSLAKNILDYGYPYFTDNRKTIPCIQMTSVNLEIPLTEFPLLTTKKMFMKGIAEELLWFLRGQDNIQPLVEKGVNIWNKDAYNFYKAQCDIAGLRKIPFEDFEQELKNPGTIQWDVPYATFCLGDVGRNYGVQWRNWSISSKTELNPDDKMQYTTIQTFDQILALLSGLRKENPISRRHIVSAWNPAETGDTALPPCHWAFEILPRPIGDHIRLEYCDADQEYLHNLWMTANGKKSEESEEAAELLKKELAHVPHYGFVLKWHQRSVDTFLGLPFNIASYALLAHIIGSITGMIPMSIIGDLSNVHFYTRPDDAPEDVISHVELVRQQLQNPPQTFKGPQIRFSQKYLDALGIYKAGDYTFDEFINTLSHEDFILEGYESFGIIKGDMYSPTE